MIKKWLSCPIWLKTKSHFKKVKLSRRGLFILTVSLLFVAFCFFLIWRKVVFKTTHEIDEPQALFFVYENHLYKLDMASETIEEVDHPNPIYDLYLEKASEASVYFFPQNDGIYRISADKPFVEKIISNENDESPIHVSSSSNGKFLILEKFGDFDTRFARYYYLVDLENGTKKIIQGKESVSQDWTLSSFRWLGNVLVSKKTQKKNEKSEYVEYDLGNGDFKKFNPVGGENLKDLRFEHSFGVGRCAVLSSDKDHFLFDSTTRRLVPLEQNINPNTFYYSYYPGKYSSQDVVLLYEMKSSYIKSGSTSIFEKKIYNFTLFDCPSGKVLLTEKFEVPHIVRDTDIIAEDGEFWMAYNWLTSEESHWKTDKFYHYQLKKLFSNRSIAFPGECFRLVYLGKEANKFFFKSRNGVYTYNAKSKKITAVKRSPFFKDSVCLTDGQTYIPPTPIPLPAVEFSEESRDLLTLLDTNIPIEAYKEPMETKEGIRLPYLECATGRTNKWSENRLITYSDGNLSEKCCPGTYKTKVCVWNNQGRLISQLEGKLDWVAGAIYYINSHFGILPKNPDIFFTDLVVFDKNSNFHIILALQDLRDQSKHKYFLLDVEEHPDSDHVYETIDFDFENFDFDSSEELRFRTGQYDYENKNYTWDLWRKMKGVTRLSDLNTK